MTGVSVLVRYFAAAAEAAGRADEVWDEPVENVGELRAALVARYGAPMSRVLETGSFLVDGIVSRDPSRPVGARVDVLPPFAGG